MLIRRQEAEAAEAVSGLVGDGQGRQADSGPAAGGPLGVVDQTGPQDVAGHVGRPHDVIDVEAEKVAPALRIFT